MLPLATSALTSINALMVLLSGLLAVLTGLLAVLTGLLAVLTGPPMLGVARQARIAYTRPAYACLAHTLELALVHIHPALHDAVRSAAHEAVCGPACDAVLWTEGASQCHIATASHVLCVVDRGSQPVPHRHSFYRGSQPVPHRHSFSWTPHESSSSASSRTMRWCKHRWAKFHRAGAAPPTRPQGSRSCRISSGNGVLSGELRGTRG